MAWNWAGTDIGKAHRHEPSRRHGMNVKARQPPQMPDAPQQRRYGSLSRRAGLAPTTRSSDSSGCGDSTPKP